jgi:hypothetical protein
VKDLKLWIGLLALFLSGVCVGGVGTWLIAEQRIIDSLTHERPPFHRAIMRKLSRELDLSENQRERVAKIVCRAQEELSALRESIRPEREEIMQRSRETLKVELSPQQQQKLDELYKKLERHRSKQGSGQHREQWHGDSCD